MKGQRLWGAGLKEETPERVIDFLSGRDVCGRPPCDEELIPYDIWGSKAHTIMLWRQGILAEAECREILKGLREIETLYECGEFRLEAVREDVHSNIESRLIERFGVESVGKMHTARSRNDQIALDMRLYLRDRASDFVGLLADLLDTLTSRAGKHLRTIMPGYTHHQHAMVTTFGHMLIGLAAPLERDIHRFMNWYGLFNRNPLGGAAGYGTVFPLDRDLTSRLLAFDGPQEHSTDPLTNRWEPETELAFAVSVMMNHLSTIAQTFILMSTREFGMIRLNDLHTDGSSMMPQKKNPGLLEVIKAKASLAHGMLAGLLSVARGMMVGYNKESQWTKYMVMDVVSECAPAVSMMKEVVEKMEVDESAMGAHTRKGFIAATHLLESIVKHTDIPFRQGKELVERAVRVAERAGREEVVPDDLEKATAEMGLNLRFSADSLAKWQDPVKVVESQRVFGGPAPSEVRKRISVLRKRIKDYVKWHRDQSLRVRTSIEEIESIQANLGIT